MRKATAVFGREIRAYVTSPASYVVMGLFIGLIGYLFVAAMSVPFAAASVRGYLEPATLLLVLVAPALTMRLLAEEQKLGTLELLLTAPVRDWEIVVGKFLASTAWFVAGVAMTSFYVGLLYWLGNPDTLVVIVAYFGFILYGTATLAIGLFGSSLTANQVVAAFVSLAIILPLYLLDAAADQLEGSWRVVLNYVSIRSHFDNLSRGILDVQGVVYYISLIGTFLFLAVRSLEVRRWR